MVRLARNKKQTYQINFRPQMGPYGLTLAMTLTLYFQIWNLLYLSYKSDCHETKRKNIEIDLQVSIFPWLFYAVVWSDELRLPVCCPIRGPCAYALAVSQFSLRVSVGSPTLPLNSWMLLQMSSITLSFSHHITICMYPTRSLRPEDRCHWWTL